jgi:RNA polymerase sigma-70 factor, ECF subfamily
MNIADNFSDEELIELARNGSEVHFNQLVDRHAHAVYRLAFSITGSRQEAEDVVQETFLRVFKHMDQFSPARGSFKSWLLTVARNQGINVFSSIQRRASRFFGTPEPDAYRSDTSDHLFADIRHNPEQLLSIKEQHSRLEEALMSLPERQRTALLLKAHEGMSYDEIATVMKATVSSVESLIFRARKCLTDILKD